MEFGTIQARDSFRAFAPRLSCFNRTAGMRLAIQDYMMSSFKVLENEAFRIAQRRPGTKRSIKYDDASRTLVLDIKLPDAVWVRITTEQVKKAVRGRKQVYTPQVDEILAIGGMDLPPRPSSPSDHPEVASDDEEMSGEETDQQQQQ